MSFVLTVLFSLCLFLPGEEHSSKMPWRSNTGVPFGNAIYDNPEFLEGSEASGFSGDAAAADGQHDLSGSMFGGPFDAEAVSVVDSQPGHADNCRGVQLDSELVATEPARKRQALDMALRKGTGPDKRLFFSMLKLRRTGVPKMPWDTGVAADVQKRASQFTHAVVGIAFCGKT